MNAELKKYLIGLLKSRTTWVNIVGGALQIVNLSQGIIAPEKAVMIQGGLNLLMRVLTTEAVNKK
jgi:hypothetical protein